MENTEESWYEPRASFKQKYWDGTKSFGYSAALLLSLFMTMGGFFSICLGLRAFSCKEHRHQALPHIFLGLVMIGLSWHFFLMSRNNPLVSFGTGVFCSLGAFMYIATAS